MRYGIFSDVHGNVEALEMIEAALRNEKLDECFCLGDIVGYGANPSECIAKVKKIASVIIAGNHDWAVAGKFDIENFTQDAKDAILWTHRTLSIEEKRFLFNLPLIYKENNFTLVHGTLSVPEEFNYVLDVSDAEENLQIQDTSFCFVGHSHIPEIYVSDAGVVLRQKSQRIKADKCLVNVGSVGQPRDGDNRASYCIFDSDKKTVSINRVRYNVKGARDKILAAGLPSLIAYRLLEGK